MCVTMSNMRHVSVRDVQHHLARVLAMVEEGEEIEITRRNAVVARLVPAGGRQAAMGAIQRPDYGARLAQMYPAGELRGAPGEAEIERGRSREE